jgi:SAM-dependent methyltransferase
MMAYVSIEEQVPGGTVTELTPQARLGELITGLWKSHVTAAIARLGIPDQLVPGPRTAVELAGAVPADAGTMGRLLRAGASLGLLEVIPPDRYRLTAVGECLLTGTSSLREYAFWITAPALVRPLELLAGVVATGQPAAQQALGQDMWSYLREHPDEHGHFAGAMTGLSALSAPLVAARLDVSPYQRVVDLGGGHGFLLRALLARAPGSRGVLFDLPEVIASAQVSMTDNASPGPPIEKLAGSFLEKVPADGDLYVLANVLVDWGDAEVMKILRNCHRAGRPGHALAVTEPLLPERPDTPLPFLLDLTLLASVGGQVRTAGQYRGLLAEAGYQLEQVVALPGGQSILLARAH